MGQPICPNQGIAFAFPDVCSTPTPGGPVPVPYPNIADLSAATGLADQLLLGGGQKALLAQSEVATSTGDEAGNAGGPTTIKGKMRVVSGSSSVLYGGKGIARFGDPTKQNNDNADGRLMGAFATVLVGG